MAKLSISILSADFLHLDSEIRLITDGGADHIHIDAMDGRFVPNISFGQFLTQQLAAEYSLTHDIHIMAVEPERQIDAFLTDKTEYIVIHYETVAHLDRTLNYIRSLGVKSGVALNPGSSPEAIEYALYCADQVLVMSVNPGYGGQEFTSNAIEKINCLAEMREKAGYGYEISVDGGINKDMIKTVIGAGADILIVGSAIFNAEDKVLAMKEIRELSKNAFSTK